MRSYLLVDEGGGAAPPSRSSIATRTEACKEVLYLFRTHEDRVRGRSRSTNAGKHEFIERGDRIVLRHESLSQHLVPHWAHLGVDDAEVGGDHHLDGMPRVHDEHRVEAAHRPPRARRRWARLASR
eukprot:CAMPEP_0119380336 /NCGR_PEP_ID=MMETSP1334-20130426/56527_1 /TAXON_ID=127549 /ORGANISM="Calcidiscus leptoporus, Strain RCC1130" /LENGTH=125 /DNA_ID=CAMNT_0007400123 /DNA_START=337 /DNA_END=709 /DNA_ORIENTATION=+